MGVARVSDLACYLFVPVIGTGRPGWLCPLWLIRRGCQTFNVFSQPACLDGPGAQLSHFQLSIPPLALFTLNMLRQRLFATGPGIAASELVRSPVHFLGETALNG